MIEKILVLGSTGFVGSHIFNFLNAISSVEVHGLSSVDIDLTDSSSAFELEKIFPEYDYVVMCSGIKSDYGNDLDAFTKNVYMAQNVARALSLAKSKPKSFIFFSSLAVSGVDKHNREINESSLICCDTYYGLSKYVSEQLIDLALHGNTTINFIKFRTPTIYGYGDKIEAHTPSGFLSAYMDGREVELWGGGSELREFIYVEDIPVIIYQLLQSSYSGPVVIGSGQPCSYVDVLDKISEIIGRKARYKSKKRTKEKIDKVVDPALFKILVPDFEFTSLQDGLRLMKLKFDENNGKSQL